MPAPARLRAGMTSETPSARTLPTAWALLLLFAAATLSTWLHGYRYGDSNHAFLVPLLKSRIDPELYRGDILMMARDRHATVLYPLLGLLLPGVGWIEPVFYLLFLLSQWITFAAGAALAARLHPGTRAPVAMVVLMMAPIPGLGGEWGVPLRFTHTELAFGVLLWAIALALAERRRWASALAGAGFDLQALYGLYAASMLGAEAVGERRRLGARELVRLAATFAVCALPAASWLFAAMEPLGEEWTALVRLRSAHHSFPFDFPAREYGRYLPFLALGALSLRDPPRGIPLRRLAHLLAALGALLAVGVLFAEWYPVAAVIRAQLFRSTRFLSVLVLLGLSRFLPCAWSRGGFGRLGVVLCLAALFSGRHYALMLPAILMFLLVEPRDSGHARKLAALAGLMGGLVWGGRAFEIAPLAALAQWRPEPAAWALPLGLLMVLAATRWALGRGRGARLLVAVASASFLILASAGSYTRSRAVYRDDPLVRLQEWVRLHTPRDAVLLTPPALTGMRVYSERSLVGEWKDGTLQYFSQSFNREWYRRMQELGAAGSLDGLGPAELQALARRYGATHLILRARTPFPLAELHREGEWAVYRIRSPDPMRDQPS